MSRLKLIDIKDIDESFEKFDFTGYSTYLIKKYGIRPTHYTLELQEDGFEKIKYWIKK